MLLGVHPDDVQAWARYASSVDDRQVLPRIIIPFGLLVLAYRYTQTQRGQRT